MFCAIKKILFEPVAIRHGPPAIAVG